jgi:outer membrane biosynthesis protein TonB
MEGTMDKYRLTWKGDGSLDLSQVLDDRGQPIVLAEKGAGANVDAVTFKHPLVQHYLKAGLEATKLGGPAPVSAPAPAPAAAPKPAPKAAPKPEPPKEEPPKEEPKTTEVDLTDNVSVEEKPVVVTSAKAEEPKEDADEDAPSSKGSRRRGRGSRSGK